METLLEFYRPDTWYGMTATMLTVSLGLAGLARLVMYIILLVFKQLAKSRILSALLLPVFTGGFMWLWYWVIMQKPDVWLERGLSGLLFLAGHPLLLLLTIGAIGFAIYGWCLAVVDTWREWGENER